MSEDKTITTRDNSFDVCRALLIFLVILGHFFQGSVKAAEVPNQIIDWGEYFIYSFHMPAFMFISGWFCYGKQYSFKPYLRNTILYLCVPLVIWDVAINAIDYFTDSFNGLNSLLTSPWYVKSIILVRVLAYPFIYKPSLLYGCCLFLLGLLLGQYYLLALLIPAFMLGFFSRKYDILKNKYVLIACAIAYLIELIKVHPSEAISDLALIRHLDLSYWLNYLNRLILGLSGTVIFIASMRQLFKSVDNAIILGVGKATLGIYIIQALVVERLLLLYVSSYNNILLYFGLALASLVVCYAIVLIFKKLKYGWCFVGR